MAEMKSLNYAVEYSRALANAYPNVYILVLYMQQKTMQSTDLLMQIL